MTSYVVHRRRKRNGRVQFAIKLRKAIVFDDPAFSKVHEYLKHYVDGDDVKIVYKNGFAETVDLDEQLRFQLLLTYYDKAI